MFLASLTGQLIVANPYLDLHLLKFLGRSSCEASKRPPSSLERIISGLVSQQGQSDHGMPIPSHCLHLPRVDRSSGRVQRAVDGDSCGLLEGEHKLNYCSVQRCRLFQCFENKDPYYVLNK